jgi:membrane-associated phospholipid phosphatase
VAFREHPIDNTLIAIDKFVFRTNPTEAVSALVNPWLTEYLQITYSLFYFIPITHLIELIIWSDYKIAYKFTSSIVIGYYILFILYFTFPAVGPRYTLHDISSIDKERPGIWLALPFRHAVDNSDSILTVDGPYKTRPNRDCMSSGHTIFTLIAIISAFSLKTKFRWFLLVWGSSAIFATIYLCYHYVIDLIFGAFIGLIIARFLLNAYREKFDLQEVYQRITEFTSIRF